MNGWIHQLVFDTPFEHPSDAADVPVEAGANDATIHHGLKSTKTIGEHRTSIGPTFLQGLSFYARLSRKLS